MKWNASSKCFLLLSITTVQEWLMVDGNKAQAAQKLHAVEETLNDPMCHRTYILTLGLYPHHAIENGLKKIFS